MQADLPLCHSNFREKCAQDQTQNSHLKQCISWGYGIDNSILQCTSVFLPDTQNCSVFISCIYSIYTFLYNILICF